MAVTKACPRCGGDVFLVVREHLLDGNPPAAHFRGEGAPPVLEIFGVKRVRFNAAGGALCQFHQMNTFIKVIAAEVGGYDSDVNIAPFARSPARVRAKQ